MTDSLEAALPPPAEQPQRLSLPMAQPRVTYVLLAINVLVFLAMTVAGGSTNTAVLIRFGAKANALIAQGQVWRFLTSIFLHIGPMHLFFNSYALFIFGVEVERVYGSARFLAIYLLAGLLQRQRERFASAPHAARALLQVGQAEIDRRMDPQQLAAWTVVAQTVLNLDEAIHQR